ncbi:UvrD-helicase domain-containing protein [Sodaliphilus pleomorphus]|uniref:DNA 3'-5' helicase n=1 Tax=Sodaliphilus pleomorphus TaxID=2606626 RepID=A0A6L5XCJ1_9BACT|nr:UvrD-helicase domain-containing protein [Sodaliphilus pleomorphus]MSS16918.1 AAA family ATPase [Sodaliphilus pleomorphus]
MEQLQVIKASAGSGKTFNLAKNFIELLLWSKDPETGRTQLRPCGSNYHEHMLAITFTNKATNEMKQRIVAELYKLSKGEGQYLDDYIKTHGDSKEEIQNHAKSALKGILHGYTHFNVSTIDSFFQSVVRNFAHELDCDFNYDVQLDEKYATSQALRVFLHDLGRTPGAPIEKWVKKYVETLAHDEGKWNIYNFDSKSRNSLLNFAEFINKEQFKAHNDEIRTYLSKMSHLTAFQKAVATQHKACDDYCKNFAQQLHDFLGQAGIDVVYIKSAPVKKLLDAAPLGSNTINTLRNYDDTALEKKVLYKGKVAPETISACSEKFAALLADYLANYDMSLLLDSLLKNIWRLGLLGAISTKLQEMNRDNESIMISDTNELVAKALKGGVPFVYERMGTWLYNFMIDEFQDTSTKQYENFIPLLEDSLSKGNGNLIIGDEKQSIYRFRDSNPDILQNQLRKEFGEYYNDSTKLNTNYRSLENIVEFNNAFFKKLLGSFADYEKLQATYSNLKQDTSPAAQASELKGYVRVNCIYGPKEMPSHGDEAAPKATEQVLELLPQYLLDLKRDYGFEFKDMLILVNRNNEGKDIVQKLLSHNATCDKDDCIDIVSGESLLLSNSPSVRLIVSVLRFIDSTQYHSDEDDSNDAAHAKTPQELLREKRLSEQFRYKMLHEFGRRLRECGDETADCGKLLAQCFDQNNALRNETAQKQIKAYNEEIKTLMADDGKEMTTLTGLVDKIIKEYIAGSGNSGDTDTAFLLAFQNFVLNFAAQRSCGGTVHEFLKYWDDKKDKAAVPSGNSGNAVNIMTIHASKGLEAPCVIIPFASWPMADLDDITWLDRETWKKINSACPHAQEAAAIQKEGGEIVPPLIPLSTGRMKMVGAFNSYYKTLYEEDLIDKVNKTYVAFTRASQQLHLFVLKPKRNTGDRSIDDLAKSIMPKIDRIVTHYWPERHPDDTDCDKIVDYWELGCPEQCRHKPQDDDSTQCTCDMPSYAVNSALSRLEVKLPESATAMQQAGNSMHSLMSMIKRKGDEKRALRYAQRRHLLGTNPDATWNLERARSIITGMLNNPRTRDWFDPKNKVYNERTIVVNTGNGQPPVLKRPDHIVVRPDGTTIVVDYKFGASHTPAQVRAHKRQVQQYARLLAQAGHNKVEGYLWYADSNTVVPVTPTGNGRQ